MAIARYKPSKNSIPDEIRGLITERHILSSEDPESYDNLLNVLVTVYRPKGVLQWLGVKNLQNLLWDQQRLNRYKPAIIESAKKKALVALLSSIESTSTINHTSREQSEKDANGWFTDPSVRAWVDDLLRQFNLSVAAIDARAFTIHANELQILEKMQISNEARQYELRRQLEQEQQLSINPPTPDK